ncbi:hypothetical protein PM082_020725 [Marasmius tenuissimus]|nr:hypothetical protein PM082_020725 [Marasmius tenuissimus]
MQNYGHTTAYNRNDYHAKSAADAWSTVCELRPKAKSPNHENAKTHGKFNHYRFWHLHRSSSTHTESHHGSRKLTEN